MSVAEEVERKDGVYGPFIKCLRRHGIVRGHHEVLADQEWAAVAQYIRRKVEQRVGKLPPIRTDPEMRKGARRLHPFWNPYTVPRS